MATRRMRGFKRWMKLHGINYSDALQLVEENHNDSSVSVRALSDLHDGDVVATIPKQSCLTMKTSGARHVIEDAGLDGYLGLSVALMYEKSLGPNSPWFGYLQILPQFEPVPLMWPFHELDALLAGTELHKIVKEDRALINEDWKECILPLFDSTAVRLNPEDFSIEQYLMAKSLISSRSFAIDDYHEFGMVPLADLFNHKTDAEDVHFTSVASHDDSDMDSIISDGDSQISGNHSDIRNSVSDGNKKYEKNIDDVGSDSNDSDDPAVLQMIIIKEVEAGAEVFNTYGSMGNAALLHRYGFTEPENPYDIVNIDLELVLHWSSPLFSSRYSRSRIALWKKLDYSGCLAQNSEYFEISFDGEPEIELLILLYIMSLSEEEYNGFNILLSTTGTCNKLTGTVLSEKVHIVLKKGTEIDRKVLLTKAVRSALLAIAELRDSMYGSRSLEDDIIALSKCCWVKERKLYHSLVLRVSERRILQKLRAYASAGAAGTLKKHVRTTKRKKF